MAELLSKAEAADQSDIPDGMDIPTELAIRQERIKAIKEAKAEIERRAALRHAKEQEEYESKVPSAHAKNRKPAKSLAVRNRSCQRQAHRKKIRST